MKHMRRVTVAKAYDSTDAEVVGGILNAVFSFVLALVNQKGK